VDGEPRYLRGPWRLSVCASPSLRRAPTKKAATSEEDVAPCSHGRAAVLVNDERVFDFRYP